MLERVGETMQPVDYKIRDEILAHKGNIVISASAGTGKTHTTIQRIVRDLELCTNYQSFAAITFTRKAAKEIKERLGPLSREGFVGTNDNFVWQEIIQPFMYDAYGQEFKIEIKPDYTDENQIYKYEEGIEKIRDTQMMCKYENNKKNFSFQLALNILKKSDSARKYMMAKYFRIYIDEYQDSDIDMHNFFMFLTDTLGIKLFIVGDEKQSIYGWRGAYSDGFTSLFSKKGFKKFELWHNFRSNLSIQNYSNMFMEAVRKNVQNADFNDEVMLYSYSGENNALDFIKKWIHTDLNCAILNFSNRNAERWSSNLINMGMDFIYIPATPLDDSRLESEHVWIARSIASYIYTKRYSEYDFFDEIPMPDLYEIRKVKKLLEAIVVYQEFEEFEEYCIDMYQYLDYDVGTEQVNREIRALWEVVTDEKYIPSYNQDDYKYTSGTIHSSKGLEYKQVIINAGDYDFSREGIKYLHYVAVSRPEERLLILVNSGYKTRRYMGYIEEAIEKTKELGKDLEIEQLIRVVN